MPRLRGYGWFGHLLVVVTVLETPRFWCMCACKFDIKSQKSLVQFLEHLGHRGILFKGVVCTQYKHHLI